MSAQYEAVIRQSGAVALWPFGTSYNRDVIGGNHFTTSPPNRHIQDFGSFTRVVGIGASPATVLFSRTRVLTAQNNFAMEIWVRPLGQSQSWGMQNGLGGTNGYSFGNNTVDGRVYGIAQGVAVLEVSARSLPLGVWNHIVFTRDANVWKYWINGILFSTGANSNTPGVPGGTTIFNTESSMDVANYALYTRVLSYAEMQQHILVGRRVQSPITVNGGAPVDPAVVRPAMASIGLNGFAPDIEGPEVLDAPFTTIDVDTFQPQTVGFIDPPFMTVGFYAGPVQPGSESPGPPVAVDPVFLAEGTLPPFVPPSLPPTTGGGAGPGGGGGTVPPEGPGVPLPPLSSGGLAGIRFYQGPPWRWVVTDLDTNTITFLDRLTFDAEISYRLNGGSTAKLSIPSANPEVNILHTDGEPFVSEGNRLLYGFRREGGTPLWQVRFAGKILQVEDTGETENARTIVTAFDPWHLLYQRPMIDELGEFPDEAGFFSFDDTQAGNIALIFLRNTILNNGSGLNDHGDLGIDTGDGPFPGAEPGNLPGTSFWDGVYEPTTQRDTFCQQGMMVGEVWDQQLETGSLDIVMTPIYDPINRPGYMCDLSIYELVGSQKDDAVFAWDKPSRNLVAINALKDGTKRANTIRYYYGEGGPPSGGGIPLSYGPSIIKYGETWHQQFYPGRIDVVVNALATLQLELMEDGIRTVHVTPTPERMPFLFTEFWLGDMVPVFASSNLRQSIAGYQRIYGVVLTVDENSYEQVPQLLVSPEDA